MAEQDTINVLIVDDEQLVRWFLERALKRWNFNVTAVASAEEAIRLLETKSYQLVFTDWKMPSGSGAAVLQKVSEMQTPPHLIVCSAYVTPEMEEEFRLRGLHTLKKPFKLDELESCLKGLIST